MPGGDSNVEIETVVKLGGGLLADVGCFDNALAAIRAAADSPSCRLLIVPGGGPFADTVRDVDRRLGLSDAAAHWMAVMAMDQYAHVIAGRLRGAVIVEGPSEIAAARTGRRLPVLAPSRWLRETDPLPHSWDVTSDSIAAWVAGRVGARRLVLLKPPGMQADAEGGPVDAYLSEALPPGVRTEMIPADQIDALRTALRAL